MTYDKAIRLLAGCEVFENSTGKKILVHWAKALSPTVVEIKGTTMHENKDGVRTYSDPMTWTHNEVT